MTWNPALAEGDVLTLVRAAWQSHDARWFNAVAEEFGMEAANRLNQRAVRGMAVAEARRLASRLGGIGVCDELREFLAFVEAGREVYVPASMMELRLSQVDERTYDVEVERCFVAENIARAGIADVYECAVFERVAAWHEALGLPLAERPAALPCGMARGERCQRRLRIAVREGDGAAEASAQRAVG